MLIMHQNYYNHLIDGEKLLQHLVAKQWSAPTSEMENYIEIK